MFKIIPLSLNWEKDLEFRLYGGKTSDLNALKMNYFRRHSKKKETSCWFISSTTLLIIVKITWKKLSKLCHRHFSANITKFLEQLPWAPSSSYIVNEWIRTLVKTTSVFKIMIFFITLHLNLKNTQSTLLDLDWFYNILDLDVKKTRTTSLGLHDLIKQWVKFIN